MRNVDAETAGAVLQAELKPGEVLEWAGRPSAATLAFKQLYGLAFVIVYISIGCGFLTLAVSERAGWPVAASVLLLAYGLFNLWNVVASLVAAWQTFYGVTNRRLLMVELGLRRRITSWTPQQITTVKRRDRSGGRGDVIFRQTEHTAGRALVVVSVAFVNVAEVRTVEACIRRLAAS